MIEHSILGTESILYLFYLYSALFGVALCRTLGRPARLSSPVSAASAARSTLATRATQIAQLAGPLPDVAAVGATTGRDPARIAA